MGENKQIERLIKILQRLSIKPETTVAELYRYFDGQVSKRTLQRDLITLSNANIPLQSRTKEGKEQIWYIEQFTPRFMPIMFQSREIMAGTFVKTFSSLFKGTPLQDDAESFFKRAKQLYPVDIFADADNSRFDNCFGFSQTGRIDYSPFAPIINDLIKSITERIPVRMKYRALWKDTDSDIAGHPYMILFHKGALYAVVYIPDSGKYYTLPIQRIKKLELSDTHFKRDKRFSIEQILEGRIGIFGYEGLKPQRVVLKFSKDIADTVAERIWHPSQKIKRHPDGSLTLEMKVVISDELRGWIASWLEYVEVKEPRILTGIKSTSAIGIYNTNYERGKK